MKLHKSILVLALVALTNIALADTIGQATSFQGHRLRVTNQPCDVVSGRSSQQGWGRTYSWQDNGTTLTGCGQLDNDTVLIEWFIPPRTIDSRRYPVDQFTWAPGYGNRNK